MRGIDNWRAVKANWIDFAICRSSYGKSKFEGNILYEGEG